MITPRLHPRLLPVLLRNALRLGAIGLPLLLGACASLSPPGAPQAASALPARYSETIDLKGRLSLRYERNGKEEAMHGNFEWSQTPRRIALTMLSPLGQTLATVEITPDSATLTQANQPPRTAPDADALIADTLGWPLPVSGLRDWLQGFAFDAAGKRVAATRQTGDTITTRDGWHLHYVSWEDAASPPQPGAARPKRIDIERYTAQAGQVSVRIVIDEWQPH
jgi:outer membrane lipoprotein LolB